MAISKLRQGLTHMVAKGNDVTGVPLTTTDSLTYHLFRDLVAGGFEVVETDTSGGLQADTTKVIFRPGTTVDPIAANQDERWHIYFETTTGSARMPNPTSTPPGALVSLENTGLSYKVGSRTQLADIATASASTLHSYPIVLPDFMRYLTSEQAALGGITNTYPRLSIKTPMSYQLTVVERGFALGIWTQVFTEDYYHMGVVCVQRGVGCDGNMISTGQKPLYMVTNVAPSTANLGDGIPGGPKNNWFYQIPREVDTASAYPFWISNPQAGTVNNAIIQDTMISDPNESMGRVLNYFPVRWFTPVTTDTGEYVLVFPFGMCTSRFAFSDEIDLIAVSKADAYQSSQVVPINVYGEERFYTAYNSNNQSSGVNGNGGTRIFMYTKGPEIPEAS